VTYYKTIITFILVIGFSVPLYAGSYETTAGFETDEVEDFDDGFEVDNTVFEFDVEETAGEDISFDNDQSEIFGDDVALNTKDTQASFLSSLFYGARFTLKHEVFYKVKEPTGIMSNRSSVRLEVARPIGRHFFLQLDTKETFFWENDHRAEAVNKKVTTEPFTREAFLQASFVDTSIKAGIQILIWGESEGGAITDVISPRDYSEAFFISLEESRIGQPMVLLDQFTSVGDFSVFFVPDADFNEYPEKNTAYEYNLFGDSTPYRTQTSGGSKHEFGGRWKKTFGQSDVAVMAASLIENDYAYRADGSADDGETIITREEKRFTMAGATFNHVRGSFLYKGEVGIKWPRHFNNSDLQIEKRDVLDTAIGMDYSPGGAYTLSLELVNRHIMDWEEGLTGVRKNANSVVLVWDKNFLNETLSVNWMSIYTTPDQGFVHTLRTAYEWNDYLTLKFEAFYPDISDSGNSYWIYRDQKQVALKFQIQF
jgi:hypothetical protein